MQRQSGFTLIELIMVIVVLGILAAFALPRFADFGQEARIATLKGAQASVRSAATIAHSTQLAKGVGANASVTLEGVVIDMLNGYPGAMADVATTKGIISAAQLSSKFEAVNGAPTGSVLTIRVKNAPSPINCSFTYTLPAQAGNPPTYGELKISGC